MQINSWPKFSKEELNIVSNVLSSGKVNYWQGNEGKLFEKEFSEYIGTNNSVAVANGSIALSLAYEALNIGNTDEVITTPRTYIATSSSLVRCGAKPIFADGVAPATFQITPKFSNGSTITSSLPLDWPQSGISADPMENTITTFPLRSIGNNKYQVTMTNSLPSLVNPIFYLDGIKISFPNSISFNNASTNSTIRLDTDRIHIKHPDIPEIPKAAVTIEPTFSDGSVISSPIPTSEFNFILTRLDGSTANDVIKTPVEGPLYDSNGNPYYQIQIEATSSIEAITISLEISGRKLSQSLTLSFDIPDPTKSEIKTTKTYMLKGSNQSQEIQVIPRFSNNSIISSDLSRLVFLSVTSGTLSNQNGESTTNHIGINPSLKASGILTASYSPANVEGLSFISGIIQAAGFKQISQQGQINSVNANPNLLRIKLLDESIPADATAITTLIVTPLFPDNTPIGKEFNADLLTASITDGEFLKKAPSIINSNQFSLFPAGTSNVSFFNLNEEKPEIDGDYELSIRASNFSTIARINFFVENTLSLISEQISFELIGSADPIRTQILISNPIIYANGEAFSKIDIYPKASNGQSINLPTTSSVIIQSNHGTLIGVISKNLDNSYSQLLIADPNSVNKTAHLTVTIDGIKMTPNNQKTVKFIDLDVSNLVNNVIYPDNNLIDGYDVAILAKAIRQRICTNNLGDCTLDFNGDGIIDTKDLDILKTSYGSNTND